LCYLSHDKIFHFLRKSVNYFLGKIKHAKNWYIFPRFGNRGR
jgi:hypothetical protein